MIVYTVIARFVDSTVFAESILPGVEGNIPQVTVLLLKALQSKDIPDGARRTFAYRAEDAQQLASHFCGVADPTFWNGWCSGDVYGGGGIDAGGGSVANEYFFHLLKEAGIVYMSLTEEAGRPSINFSFLEEVREAFNSQYSQTKIRKASAFAMDKAFSPKISAFMHHYNTNPKAGSSSKQSLAALNAQVEDLKNVMGDNIQLLLKRGEDIESMLEKTEELEMDSRVFRKTTKVARKTEQRQYWKQNRFTAFAMVLAALLAVFFFSLMICGGNYSRCRSS